MLSREEDREFRGQLEGAASHTASWLRLSLWLLGWEVQEEEGDIKLHHMETGYQLPYNCSITISAPGRLRLLLMSEMTGILIFYFQSTSR